jgi:hypothetical protein
MKTTIRLTLATVAGAALAFSAAAAAAFSADPAPAEFAGNWATSDDTFNTMHFSQDGDHVTGPYDFRDGRADGTVKGSTFEGVWAQSGSSQECGSSKLGSTFWGRLELHRESDGAFSGVWGYCDDEPNKPFTGKRL